MVDAGNTHPGMWLHLGRCTMEDVAEKSARSAASGIPARVTFRVPTTALLAVAFMLFCATPFAFAAPGAAVIYILPLAAAVWVVRNRTTVDAERIEVRYTFGHRALDWSQVAALRVVERGWVRAVLADSSEVVLPAVRLRHVPVMAAVSRGRIPDPIRAEATENQG